MITFDKLTLFEKEVAPFDSHMTISYVRSKRDKTLFSEVLKIINLHAL